MKKLFSLILTIAIIVAAVYVAPKLVHTCDACESFFIGPGYEPNVLTDLLAQQETICKECAEDQHAAALALGGDLKEYQKPLF